MKEIIKAIFKDWQRSLLRTDVRERPLQIPLDSKGKPTPSTLVCWNLSDEATCKRFKIEVQPAAALNHTNIATIHTIEEVADELFIVWKTTRGRNCDKS